MSERDTDYILNLCRAARGAAGQLARTSDEVKNQALQRAGQLLLQHEGDILAANAVDMRTAEVSGAMRERLELTPERVQQMADGVNKVAELENPVGQMFGWRDRPSGIQVGQMRVPLGVIGIVYESRPNVTADAAALCIKSGNAVILRGGSEALHSNQAIVSCLAQGLREAKLDEACAQLVEDTDRALVGELIGDADNLDLVIPRGGQGLIERVLRESRVPVLSHRDGVCHLFIDASADEDMAVRLVVNSKTRRYGVCNALETLLVDASMLSVLARVVDELVNVGVEIRGCERACAVDKRIVAASEADWREEYLGPILAVRVVDDYLGAIEHINHYGSHHTDCIVTNNTERAESFIRWVDSSSVLVNASTGFADGYEYGLGAEVGISTDKLHARGPVGLEGLTSCKYIVRGHGEIRS